MKCNDFTVKLSYSTKVTQYSMYSRSMLLKLLTDSYNSLQEGLNYEGKKFINANSMDINVSIPLYDDDELNNIYRLTEVMTNSVTASGVYTTDIKDLKDMFKQYNELNAKLSMYTEQLKSQMNRSKFDSIAKNFKQAMADLEALKFSTTLSDEVTVSGMPSSLAISYWADARFCSVSFSLDTITQIDWS